MASYYIHYRYELATVWYKLCNIDMYTLSMPSHYSRWGLVKKYHTGSSKKIFQGCRCISPRLKACVWLHPGPHIWCCFASQSEQQDTNATCKCSQLRKCSIGGAFHKENSFIIQIKILDLS